MQIGRPANVVIATWEDDLDEFDRRLAAMGMHAATGGRIKFVDIWPTTDRSGRHCAAVMCPASRP